MEKKMIIFHVLLLICSRSLTDATQICTQEKIIELLNNTVEEAFYIFGHCFSEHLIKDIKKEGSTILQDVDPNLSEDDCTYDGIKKHSGFHVFSSRIEGCLVREIEISDDDYIMTSKIKAAAANIVAGIPDRNDCPTEEIKKLKLKEINRIHGDQECFVLYYVMQSTASLNI
ncbi:hypothetical protein C0J52_08186 [Blattella germanica]|nr:hypothetical protein C0J52_08186 [Blattella germanica]